jgi:hypothetical protein
MMVDIIEFSNMVVDIVEISNMYDSRHCGIRKYDS